MHTLTEILTPAVPAMVEPRSNRISLAASWICRILGLRRGEVLPPHVLSREQIEVAFRRERDRSDRTQSHFAVVTFAPLKDSARETDLAVLATVLKGRIRTYESLGQLDSKRAALLLPDTAGAGAWQLADDALACLKNAGLEYGCEVYVYPEDWSRVHRQEGADLPAEDAAEESPHSNSRGLAAPLPRQDEEVSGHRSPTAPLEQVELSTSEQIAQSIRNVGSLQGYFAHPIPLGKRLFDIIGATIILALLSPVMLAAALLVKLSSPGPIIFRQERAGLGGKPFSFLKFRTMYIDAEERLKEMRARNIHTDGPIFKDPNDPRMTPVGRVLRRWSVDELPQLWNVVLGQMSLVGPRPPKTGEVEQYEPWQRRRLDVTGGLTCIWQVSGRSEIGFLDWVRMDIEYIRRRSPWLDFKLLVLTAKAVVSGRGAY